MNFATSFGLLLLGLFVLPVLVSGCLPNDRMALPNGSSSGSPTYAPGAPGPWTVITIRRFFARSAGVSFGAIG